MTWLTRGFDHHSNFSNHRINFDFEIGLPASSSLRDQNEKSSFLSVDSEKGNGEWLMWIFRRRGRRREREMTWLTWGLDHHSNFANHRFIYDFAIGLFLVPVPST
jgi:hypothetical protein